MRIAIIGRSQMMYGAAETLAAQGHEIALVITAKEAPEYTRTSEDFRALAKAHHAPFFHSAKIMDLLGDIQKLPAIDIAVSVNYSGIIPQAIIDCFRLGILNAHGGDLPRYRGNACQAWAILNGEERIGLCIHRMIGGELDSGDIVVRDYIPLTLRTTITEVDTWMQACVPALFAEAVQSLAADAHYVLERQSKDPALALRCYPRTPEDGRIDWNQSSVQIQRLVNASGAPYAGAFTFFEGERFIIWASEPVQSEERFLAMPGQVTHIGEQEVEIATREGKLRLLDVEHRGKRGAPALFLRSIRQRLGG